MKGKRRRKEQSLGDKDSMVKEERVKRGKDAKH